MTRPGSVPRAVPDPGSVPGSVPGLAARRPVAQPTPAPQPIPPELYPPGSVIPPGAALVRRAPWQVPRWWEWLAVRQLRCPAGHHLPNIYELDPASGARLRCSHHLAGMRLECGLWVWCYRLPGAGHLVVEATLQDAERLRQCATPSEAIDLLGVFAQLARVA